MRRSGLRNRSGGLIKFILAVILVVVILVYFRVDIKDLSESERLRRLVEVFIGLVKQAFAVFRDVLSRAWQLLADPLDRLLDFLSDLTKI